MSALNGCHIKGRKEGTSLWKRKPFWPQF